MFFSDLYGNLSYRCNDTDIFACYPICFGNTDTRNHNAQLLAPACSPTLG
jgi:hypothetical protein